MSEAVHVGGGGSVGVRVQVGMGVRVGVQVADRAAMNVLLRSVRAMEVASALSGVGVSDGVTGTVAEEVKVTVAEAGRVDV